MSSLDVEFVLPNREGELSTVSNLQYYVNEIFSPREINEVFLNLHNKLTEEGVDFIAKNFNSYYSILRNFAELPSDVKFDSYVLLLQASTVLLDELVSLLEENTADELEKYRFKYRNLTKMSVYLLCQLSNAFEQEILKPSPIITAAKKKVQKKKKKDSENDVGEKRMEFVRLMREMFKLPLHKLWDPPHIESDLLNLVIETNFGLLENPDVAHDSQMVEELIQFLGYCLKNLKTGSAYCIKIVQLVQQSAHCVSILSAAVQRFISDYSATTLVTEIFEEIALNEIHGTEPLHQLSQFVVELTEKCPDIVLASIQHFLSCLEEESHILRNCVLFVIGELMVHISKMEQIPSDVLTVREQLLNKLYEHVYDVSCFVRSKAVQIITRLFEETAVPLSHVLQFLERAAGRLWDKTATVRKSAINFLKVFITVNPYSVQIDMEELQGTYDKENVALKDLLTQVFTKSPKPVGLRFDSSDEDSEDEGAEKKDLEKEINGVENGKEMESGTEDVENGAKEAEDGAKEVEDALNTSLSQEDRAEALKVKISKQKILVDFLQLTLRCGECIAKSIPVLCKLLKSATVTDNMEAIEFFVCAFELGLKESVHGIKVMMHMIFSDEQSVKNAVVTAYKKLYLSAGIEGNQSATTIAHNLVKLLHGANDTEVFAIGEFVKEFVKSGEITDEVLDELWSMFMLKSPKTTELESMCSMTVLSMVARTNNKVVLSKIDLLVTIGLGPRARRNFQLAKETCNAMLTIDDSMKAGSMTTQPLRFKESHVLFNRISDLLINGLTEYKDDKWMPMCEKAIEVIFKLSDRPECIAVSILKKIAEMVLNQEKSAYQGTIKKGELVNLMFCRFLFLSGHVAYWFTTYLETDVFKELKRRSHLKSAKPSKKQTAQSVSRARRKSQLSANVSTVDASNGSKDETSDNDIAEEDFYLEEFINKICDEEVLNENNLLGVVFPVVRKSCMWSLKHCDGQVCATASLALAKFMSINEKACEDNIQLLVTIMEKFPDAGVRCNMILALSDLLMRFPNVAQPWVSNMYLRLKDEVPSVRKTALVTLTHLILHDRIKPKSQISEIAICIIDTEDISKAAKFLFTELSRKQNALYNIIPDIISVLSDDSSELSDENYQIIMRHIFQFVEKDRQVEALVGKLCYRFKEADSPSHLRKIAFSLSLLSFNAKCIAKLIENKACFNNKMDDEVVVNYMREVLVKGKKDHPKAESEIVQFMNDLHL